MLGCEERENLSVAPPANIVNVAQNCKGWLSFVRNVWKVLLKM